MFTIKEMTNALIRLQAVGKLPGFVCIALDREGELDGSAVGHLGDMDLEDLPRVCYNFSDYVIDDEDGKKKVAKKIKGFRKYMDEKFMKRFWKETDLGKKFREKKFPRYYVQDFRQVSVDQIVDTKAKDSPAAEFKGQTGLMITLGKGPKK